MPGGRCAVLLTEVNIEAARVAHYFVEQDQTPGDPIDSLRQSMEYL
jgi:hypothetical protein